MATKSKKKSKKSPEKKPAKSDVTPFRAEKEDKIDLKAIARDERTWKIVGAFSLLLSVFLFISFFSYLFTWKQDQAIAQQGFSALLDSGKKVSNLLGTFGAVISHLFIFNGFGLAAFLICTFFFVVGVNLLMRRKVFSIWKNLKYVTVGLLVLSIALSFVFAGSNFPFGGGVGDMISKKMTGALGGFGTGAVLLLLAAGYFIWQFNPSFNLPAKNQLSDADEADEEENDEADNGALMPAIATTNSQTLIENINNTENKIGGNKLTGEAPIVINFPDEQVPIHQFELVEKDESLETQLEKIESKQPTVEGEIVNDILLQHTPESDEQEDALDINNNTETDPETTLHQAPKPAVKKPTGPLELEIKAPETSVEEEKLVVENLPPYEPTLDLRDYKYPTLGLLEAHGSEKIIQDSNELENNKNQIISTLRNYSIEIQKISATVGPTVTLYEIVPAPGVRISKIKNLEDDIALSLAALGIRIIAPIPGKGTIGIEVPNVRKTIVSMKTLLASEKFQNNNFSLPIAIGKKIDNENFIVDLAGMPHLLMAGATGQGKSVGVNALLVSLLYKKHPSQLKFVLIDPKKVELSIYRAIEKHFLAKLP
ncbi:MAG TPA: DNA translocase FtsK 4TM domain-containing protein, partial [Chitinophagaceae bacterium]|nr:DNA translocase FtsK 4TM domain-containing protein [Chitinophagaceae bacterium]